MRLIAATYSYGTVTMAPGNMHMDDGSGYSEGLQPYPNNTR